MPSDSDTRDSVNSPGESSSTAKDGSAGAGSPALRASGLQKKRKAGPGGRGVANLTPEQLAKKRANDREAQRNIRERTKAQIESLEHTIEQLRSQQPYQELQRIISEKEAIEAENADIKRRLATVLQLIQPILGSLPDAKDTGSASQRHANLSLTIGTPTVPTPTNVPRAGYHHDQFMNPSVEPLSADSSTYTMPWQAPTNGSPGSHVAPSFAPRPRSPNGQPTLLGMASSIYRMTESEQEALNLLRLGEARTNNDPRSVDLATRSTSVTSFAPTSNGTPSLPIQVVSDDAPPWQKVPSVGNPTCTLDNIILTFRADIEKRIRQGQTAAQVLGSETPDWLYIKDPDSFPANQDKYVGALSRFFGQVLSHRMFPDLQKPPEKVGTAYLLYTSLYWVLSKDEKAYFKIPEWLRPTEIQVKTTHGPWVDAMFWPAMRDKVLTNQKEYRFDDLFVPLTRTVSCNWHYGDAEIFDLVALQSGQWALSERFLNHILKLENWTMGSEFAKAYPQLVGTYPLRG